MKIIAILAVLVITFSCQKNSGADTDAAIVSFYEKAQVEWEKKNFSKAEEYFTKALELKPGNTNYMMMVGMVKEHQKKHDEAQLLFKEIIKLIEAKDSKTAIEYMDLSGAYYQTKNIKQSFEVLKEAQEMYPTDSRINVQFTFMKDYLSKEK
ncbi:MAG: tetratricopeptide repeat protein [Lentisphaeraceae bacterium]|nr:tetratricopeptide repeat protein [Lentisphaeraceae bacterium]